ncbi:fermitin family homolog 3-like isoform X4 [Cinclus cinclus]|uniref:fermitin family homolog 3-like isoform X4 n=1 Tax=Cinclus cinclus TaxID=127875 RepID=UPI002E11E0A6
MGLDPQVPQNPSPGTPKSIQVPLCHGAGPPGTPKPIPRYPKIHPGTPKSIQVPLCHGAGPPGTPKPIPRYPKIHPGTPVPWGWTPRYPKTHPQVPQNPSRYPKIHPGTPVPWGWTPRYPKIHPQVPQNPSRYPCAMGLDPQDGLRLALLHEEALGALLAEEIECTQEQGMLFAVLQEELGAPPELEEELEIYRPSLWPFRGSRPTRARLSGSSLSLWTPPGPGGPQQELNLNECEVTPEVDLGAQKFGIKLRVRTPGGMSETLLRCRDAPQFSRWFCGCRVASGVGGSPSPTEFTRGVLEVLGVQPDGGDPPGTPSRPPPDPRLLLPPRFQSKLKGKQFTQRFLEVLYQVGPLSPPQARLRFLQAWKDLPGFGMGTFLVRFRGAGHDEVLAVGPSQLLRIDPRSGSVTRSWSYSDLRQWDVNWDSQQVRLWLSGDVTLGLRVLSAPPRVLHQFLGGYLALGGPPRDPQELQRLLEGGYDP